MNEPTSLQPGGPVLRSIVVVKLPVLRGCVSTPSPTQEWGGILPVPAGTIVRLDVGDAEHCYMHEARKIAGALAEAAEIEITGSNPDGVSGTRSALTIALNFPRLQHAS